MKATKRFFYLVCICIFAYACQEKNDDEKNSPPASPTLIAPDEALENVNTSIDLVWECNDPDNDALTYSIYFSANNPPDSLVISNLVPASYSIAGLELSKTYYWQVVAKDSYGNETRSPVWQFSTLIDFRDGFVGEYNCWYKCVTAYVGDSVVVVIDTGYNKIIGIEKFSDSSLKVSNMGGWPPNYEFRHVPFGNRVFFEDPHGNGPDDYVEFFGNDSIHGYDYFNWVHECHYYGKKINQIAGR